MLILYYAPRTCALATHIALEEVGADYQARRVDFARTEQRSPEYLKINPKGRVPALVTPQGVLTETPALLVYVAQTHPGTRLLPDDPFALAEVQAFAGYLSSTVHVAHAHGPRASRWADEPSSHADMKRKARGNMRDAFSLIEANLFRGPWAMGAAYSIIDPYLFTIAGWLASHEIDVAEFPAIAEHCERMSARESVQRALAAEQA